MENPVIVPEDIRTLVGRQVDIVRRVLMLGAQFASNKRRKFDETHESHVFY
jgi:hypothetical protein